VPESPPLVPFAFQVDAVDRRPELLNPKWLATAVTTIGKLAAVDPDSLPPMNNVRFTVDAQGRIDPSTFAVGSWSDRVNVQHKRSVLVAVRFRPAEFGGHPVPTVVGVPVRWTAGRAELLLEQATWNPGVDSLPSLEGPARPDEPADVALSEERPTLRNAGEVEAALADLYPPVLRDAGITGRVMLSFVVDSDGAIDPTSVTIVSASRYEFAAASAAVARLLKFSPARIDGRPVPVLVTMPVTWTLERSP
jgi:TonB family protein